MEEKKEFPKKEFSGFKCVLECSESWYVFSLWFDPLSMVYGLVE